jgi:hypothetical protein
MHVTVLMVASVELRSRGGAVEGRDQSFHGPGSYEREQNNMAMDGKMNLWVRARKFAVALVLLRKCLASRGELRDIATTA